MRLALSHAGLPTPRIESVRHMGGVLPQSGEVVKAVLSREEVTA